MNKETLQSYNERLTSNNVSLESMLETISELKEIKLQEKEVMPTTVNQIIEPDENYTSLSKVNVIGDSELLAENIKKDVEIFGVKGSLEATPTPTKGFVINEWTDDGYAKKITTIGFERLPESYFQVYTNSGNAVGGLFKNLEEIVLNEGITNVQSALNGLFSTKRINIPSTLTSLNYVFYNSDVSEIKTLPSTVTLLGPMAFYNTKIVQLSIPSTVTSMASIGPYNTSIKDNKQLIALWIGSGVTDLGRYAVYGCSAMKYLYIDSPRATVEAFTGYAYEFSYNEFTGPIICNDDEGFLTKEQFDAIDWTTM